VRADRGSGSIWLLAVAALVTTAAIGAAAVVGAITVRHRAAAAADLAALAAAGTAVAGGQACAAASRVALANGAQLSECHVEGLVVDVTTTVTPAGWLRSFGVSSVRSARAGPATAGRPPLATNRRADDPLSPGVPTRRRVAYISGQRIMAAGHAGVLRT
jgi:secretion/DNA translocation related TadE-like protein